LRKTGLDGEKQAYATQTESGFHTRYSSTPLLSQKLIQTLICHDPQSFDRVRKDVQKYAKRMIKLFIINKGGKEALPVIGSRMLMRNG